MIGRDYPPNRRFFSTESSPPLGGGQEEAERRCTVRERERDDRDEPEREG